MDEYFETFGGIRDYLSASLTRLVVPATPRPSWAAAATSLT